MDRRPSWFAIRHPLTPKRAAFAKVGAFVLPLFVWSVVSYVPFVWHPLVKVTDGGDSAFLQPDMRMDRAAFATENAALQSRGARPAVGEPANPIFLPAPHEVARALK